jgi:hypothetical protein
MTHHSVNAIYYGASVRIVSRGTGLSGQLDVERLNPLAGNWIVAATYYQSSDQCYSEAKQHATDLAHKLFIESKHD